MRITQPPVRDANGALRLLDETGDVVNWNGLAFIGQRIDIEQGTAAAPITEWGPTLHVGRTENYTLGSTNLGPVNTGLSNSNAVANETNAAIVGVSINKATSQMQPLGVFGGARGYSGTDSVGVIGQGRAMASGGRGSGAYFQGSTDVTGAKGVGIESRLQNNTGANSTYNSGGASDFINIWVTHSSTSVKQAGEAIGIGNITGAGAEYLYGLTFKPGSVLTGSIRDDSSAATSILLNGTHSGYGVDFNGGTFTGGVMRLPNAVQVVGRNAAGGADLAVLAVDVNNRVSLANGFLSVDTASGTTRVSSGGGLERDGANGSYHFFGTATELLTLSTGGTTTDTAANLLPAGAIILSVEARVTTTIATATSWAVGDATTAARFSAANGTMVAGTTSNGIDQWSGAVTTLAAGPSQAAAAKVRITTVGTPSAGIIRLVVFYMLLNPPSS